MPKTIQFTGHSLEISLGKLMISAGWYRGESLKLFEVTAVEVGDNWATIFEVQVLKLCFSILVV